MKIFICYASEDRAAAESIAFSLRGRGHEVFLDRDDLPAGENYDQQIERAIKDTEIFVFLISPDSVTTGRFTMTELVFARQKWPDPNSHVLPVMARKTSFDLVPPYLKAVTILEPQGNTAAETSAAVDSMRSRANLSEVTTSQKSGEQAFTHDTHAKVDITLSLHLKEERRHVVNLFLFGPIGLIFCLLPVLSVFDWVVSLFGVSMKDFDRIKSRFIIFIDIYVCRILGTYVYTTFL
jgi:hypothetical protein